MTDQVITVVEPGITGRLRAERSALMRNHRRPLPTVADIERMDRLLADAIEAINEGRTLSMRYRTMYREDPDIDHGTFYTPPHLVPWELPTALL